MPLKRFNATFTVRDQGMTPTRRMQNNGIGSLIFHTLKTVDIEKGSRSSLFQDLIQLCYIARISVMKPSTSVRMRAICAESSCDALDTCDDPALVSSMAAVVTLIA